jgi:hypothetical protein
LPPDAPLAGALFTDVPFGGGTVVGFAAVAVEVAGRSVRERAVGEPAGARVTQPKPTQAPSSVAESRRITLSS